MTRAQAVEEAPPAQARWVTPQKIARQDATRLPQHMQALQPLEQEQK